MSESEKIRDTSPVANSQMSAHIADDGAVQKSADELMAEFDRESNTRQFSGLPAKLIKLAFLAFTVFVFGTRFVTLPTRRECLRFWV